jgi:hypothetical protein
MSDTAMCQSHLSPCPVGLQKLIKKIKRFSLWHKSFLIVSLLLIIKLKKKKKGG